MCSVTAEAILESGAFHTMTIVPIDQRVYASCVYPVACLIIVMYVDNNGIRHNCHELLTAFESDVAADGRIDLHREGDMSSFLSVRYLHDIQTGEITADQESYIDTLLEQYNMTNCNSNKVPLKTSVNFDEIASGLPKTPDRELVSLYCKLIGELMFVAINTQPLIAHSVNALARFMSNATQTTSFTFWRKACLDIWPDTKLAKLLGAHSVSNTHFIPANSMRMQIPAGRMLFHLAKALNAIWFSLITLFLVGRPHLLLSLQCLPPRQNSLLYVHALLMSRIVAK
jgi:hypothetical protein